MKSLSAFVLIFGIFASGLSHAALVCNLFLQQSSNYACEFSYVITQLDTRTGARQTLTALTYDNDPEGNSVGCDNGGKENADSKKQKKNAQQGAADLKAAGVCEVVISGI